jgi:hypothetical protein
MIDCIYKAREYIGNYGGHSDYYERQSITGITSEFFPGGVAFIDYRVRPLAEGFFCEYEITTLAGEMIALNRWASRHENEFRAKAATLEKAVAKVGQFKSDIRCKVANQDAEDLIQKFIKQGEAERSVQDDAFSQNA